MSIPLTPVSAIVTFIPILLSMIYYLRVDIAEYADFKSQTDTVTRQAFYRKWTIRSLIAYAVVTIIILGIFDRLIALAEMPKEFAHLAEQLGGILSQENSIVDLAFDRILVILFVVSAIVSPSIIAVLSRGKIETAMAGDVLPLLPKNRSEQIWAFVISLNAGVSEELFFRLLLPLLFTYIFGNTLAAFAVAAVLFGLIHSYQGWVGVVATTVLGTLLTLVYLGTGNICIAVVAHAALDINGLLLQPILKSLVGRKY